MSHLIRCRRRLCLAPLLCFCQSASGLHSVASDRIRVVASDVDGTLLNSAGVLSARTATAIRSVTASGVPFIIATGKCRAGAISALGAVDASVAEELASLPGVFTNGLQVFRSGGRLAWQALVDAGTIGAVEEFAASSDLDLVAYAGDRLLTTRASPRTNELHERYREPFPEVHPSLEAMAGRAAAAAAAAAGSADYGAHSDAAEINKILVLGEPNKLVAARRALERELAENGLDASLTVAMPQMLEVLPPGCSKGDGLRRLLELEGLTAAPLMSMGDAENDLGMLEMSTTGVAMGNAAGPEVVAAARGLQTRSNDDDGAARALEALVAADFSREALEGALRGGV